MPKKISPTGLWVFFDFLLFLVGGNDICEMDFIDFYCEINLDTFIFIIIGLQILSTRIRMTSVVIKNGNNEQFIKRLVIREGHISRIVVRGK